jgi:membrane-bound metal-dependent hydrolase YbcI (DUF457 family)
MPNKEVHSGSVIIPIILYGFIFSFDFIEKNFIYFLFIFLGTLTPDFLEPAYHYTHRRFFHSIQFLKILFFFLIFGVTIGLIADKIFFLIPSFALGYIVHLLLDSFTPMGLPKK